MNSDDRNVNKGRDDANNSDEANSDDLKNNDETLPPPSGNLASPGDETLPPPSGNLASLGDDGNINKGGDEANSDDSKNSDAGVDESPAMRSRKDKGRKWLEPRLSNDHMWYKYGFRNNEASSAYFRNNHVFSEKGHGDCGGLRCLIYFSLHQSGDANSGKAVFMTMTIVMLHMLTLLMGMAAKDKETFSIFVAGMICLFFNSVKGMTGMTSHTLPPLPNSTGDIHQSCWG